MKVKYLEVRKRANGRFNYVVNPSVAVKNALGVGFESFYEDKQAATARAMEIAEDYDLYVRRGQEGGIHINEDTVDGLYAFYKTTRAYKKLKPNSKKNYDLCFSTVSKLSIKGSNTPFGRTFSRQIDTTTADKLFQLVEKSVSYHRAEGSIKVLRRMWNIGLRHGKVKVNPFMQMGIESIPSRKVLWEPEQVNLFIQTADSMGMQSMGTLALLCYELCQRPGDMRQITWEEAFNNGLMSFTQEKTGTHLDIPCSQRLLERLQGIHTDNPVGTIVLNERTGKGYDRRLYNNYRRQIMDKAGLPKHLQIRDLRRTGATEMGEAGATNSEMRSVTGHKTLDVLSIYVRPSQNQANSAIEKRQKASGSVVSNY